MPSSLKARPVQAKPGETPLMHPEVVISLFTGSSNTSFTRAGNRRCRRSLNIYGRKSPVAARAGILSNANVPGERKIAGSAMIHAHQVGRITGHHTRKSATTATPPGDFSALPSLASLGNEGREGFRGGVSLLNHTRKCLQFS